MNASMIPTAVCVTAMAVALAGCKTTVTTGERAEKKGVNVLGYTFGPPQKQDGVTKLHIPRAEMDNQKVREPHLQMEFTNKLIEEFTKEQSYKVVPHADEADGILRVKITELKMNSVRYVDQSQNDQARGVPIEFNITVHADVTMVDTRSNEMLWFQPGMKGRYDFIPSGDFAEAKREALLQACADLSREIVDQASEQW